MWSRGTVLGGRYTLVERIGGGAMGEVWRAEDQVLERRVAVKIVLPALLDDADFALRFRREARILASLSHPSIVDIHDYGEDDDQPDDRLAYIVMELVDGRPLDAIRAERGRLPAEEALDLVAQALEALQVAHEREIVHRDIKPSNLMVTTGGLVKVTDFGIARALAGTKITTSHSVFGTALYMAPEQAEGQGTVAASDLYSIGVVAYELLTGELPFTGETVLEIVLKHVREPAPALPEEFPEPVRAFVARALAKSPGDRHPTAAAMAVAARRAAEGLPDLTPPPVAAAPVAVPPVAGAAGDSADEAADEVSEDGQLAPTEPGQGPRRRCRGARRRAHPHRARHPGGGRPHPGRRRHRQHGDLQPADRARRAPTRLVEAAPPDHADPGALRDRRLGGHRRGAQPGRVAAHHRPAARRPAGGLGLSVRRSRRQRLILGIGEQLGE